MYKSKPPTEKDTFEKRPKKSKSAEPKRKSREEEAKGLFSETEGKIKEGGLRRSLKVDKDYKFTKSALQPLLKHDTGDKFKFQDKQITMTDRIKKQVRLALNMMASTK